MTTREYAETVIARTAPMDSRDPMRRCVRKHAKAAIAMIDEMERVRAKLPSLATDDAIETIDGVRARIVDACESAATWTMGPVGRHELDMLLRAE